MIHIECHSLDIEEAKWVALMSKFLIIRNLLLQIFNCPSIPRNCYRCRSLAMKFVIYNFFNKIGSLILVFLDLICSHFGYSKKNYLIIFLKTKLNNDSMVKYI